MESFQSSESYIKNDFGCPNSIQPNAAFNSSYFRCHDDISNSYLYKNDLRNSKHDSKSHPRTCATDTFLHFPTLYNIQEQRKESSYFQSQSLESVHAAHTFSSFSSSSNSHIFTTGRLDGKARPQPSVLPFTDQARTQTFPTNQLQRTAPADEMFTLRPGCSTEDVCVNNKLDSRDVTRKRTSSCCIPRRLSARSSIQESSQLTPNHCYELLIQSGLVCEFRKIDHQADKVDRVSRFKLGHKTQYQVPSTRQSEKDSPVPSVSPCSRQLDPQTGATPFRVSKLCDLHHPPGKDALPCAATSQQCSTSVSSPRYTVTRRSSWGDRMVVRKHQSRNPDSCEVITNKLCHYRRIRHTMGSTSQRQEDSWSMESSPRKLALQLKRNVRSDSRHLIRSGSSQKLPHNSTERQQDCDLLYTKRRRHQISATTRPDEGASESGRQPQCCTSPSPPTGSVQHRSRPPLTKSSRQRVASNRRGDIQDFSKMGNAEHRPVRLTARVRRSELCYARLVRLERLLSRRVQQILELRPSLGIRSTGPSTSNPSTPQQGIGSIHHNSTQVEKAFLASGSEKPGPITTHEDQEPEENLSGHGDEPAASSRQQSSAGSLAHFGWDSLTEDWSPQEKELLSSCWRASTIKTYTPIWRKWCLWCQQHKVNFRLPKPADVARYLAYLFLTEKLAYRSILVHKSAIASICETISSIKISSNHIVKHILKAIALARPTPQKVPIWDARILIKYLKDTNPDPNNLYDVSRRTATILLLCSGRRVHDLSLLHCDTQHLVDNDNSITLHPMFGSKTDSVSHQQSSWTLLRSEDQNINPLHWIRTLISISRDVRGPITNLFITTRSPVKPATPTIIGGWVKRLLSEAGIQATPGSFRSAVSSLNWLENYSINDILAKANWQHECTFQKFYRKDIRVSNNQVVGERSLSKFFSVID